MPCTTTRVDRSTRMLMGRRSVSPGSRPPGESDEKGPAARRRPKAAREAYSLYVERAAEGANEADGPLSSLSRELDRLDSARAHVLGGREVEPGLGQHPAAEL